MPFEHPPSVNDGRADEVMRLVRSGACKNVAEAVRKILRDERVTYEPDVKRIMSEVGSILKKRQQYLEEREAWDDFLNTQLLDGAEEAYQQRGGDLDDFPDGEQNPSGDHYIIGGRY